MESKSEMRQKMLARRRSFDVYERAGLEKKICEILSGSPDFCSARTVAMYMPVRGEVNVLDLWKTPEKKFVFPRVDNEELKFCAACSPDDCCRGSFGIQEPTGDPECIETIDLMLVPGIAFDRRGYRLGYGKGFYDRFLKRYPGITTMGVCFDEFVVEELFNDPWDSKMDSVVTETGIFRTEGEVH